MVPRDLWCSHAWNHDRVHRGRTGRAARGGQGAGRRDQEAGARHTDRGCRAAAAEAAVRGRRREEGPADHGRLRGAVPGGAAVTLHVDAGWVLNVQVNVSPQTTPIRDRGALSCMVQRHRYERVAGEPYYEEIPTRAATFLHTALRLRPFSDYSASIGIACAREYMEQSGMPFELPYGEVAKLVADTRSDEADLAETARL